MEQIITVSPGKVFFTDIKVPVHILMCVSYIRVHLSINNHPRDFTYFNCTFRINILSRGGGSAILTFSICEIMDSLIYTGYKHFI